MTSLTKRSKIGGICLGLLVDRLREVISPDVPQDVIDYIPPRFPSNLSSSHDVLDPVADHARVQHANWGPS